MGKNLRKLLYATVAGAPLAWILSGGQALAGAVITTGATSLGVNDTGELNFSGDGPGGFLTYGVYRNPIGDAISPGCFCEGWGVSTIYDGFTTSGFANQSSGSGGLTGGTFGSTASTASSMVGLAGAPISVSHLFGPSLQADIFQVNVTITNNGTSTANDVRYRRVMDWDVPPTEFDEFVTHQGVVANLTTAGGNVLYASNDGFASGNPLSGPSNIDPATENTDFIDNGPDDHGSLFDFAFGNLAAGESRSFNIFYGSRENEASALAALAGLGVDVFSLGQSNPNPGEGGEGGEGGGCDVDDPDCVEVSSLAVTTEGNPDGTPATFIFAFGGVGGVAPGETEENPVLPFVPAPGQFEFPAPRPRLWYDPPFAEGFTYTITGPGTEFVEVRAPSLSVGFAGPFDIVIDGIVVASILPGESYFFDPLDDPLVHVTRFDLVGIFPFLDIAGPGFATAFPTFLDFTGDALSLTMTAILADSTSVPEPGTLLLFGAGLTFVMRLRSGQRQTAAIA